MSIEYPNCDSSECWYRRNMDRLNEYKSSTKYVVNNTDMEYDRGLDLNDYNLPNRIWLCDVCDGNIPYNKKCSVCESWMYDKWIEFKETGPICRECIDNETIMEELGEDLFDKLQKIVPEGNYIETFLMDEELDDEENVDVLKHIAADIKLVVQKIKERHISEMEKEKEIQNNLILKRQRENATIITTLIPSISLEDASNITKKLKKDIDLKDITNAKELLEWFLDYKKEI